MEDYEMMCGIEIHQQLDTKKLFCSCDTTLHDEGFGNHYRKLRPTANEMGVIDRAALAQYERHMSFRYQCCESSCLVDLDEEPPHEVNNDAMDVALTFSSMLNADMIDEIHFMRKIVVDGSNTGGFQRTALVSTGGEVVVNGKKISILSVCLEEDAARKIETKGNEVTYRLDRLGFPLVEVATGPDMRTPEEVMEVALRLGSLFRATKMVKRGIGTIREDLNISIPGGARIEIKGVQDLKMLPDFVRTEVNRQKMLLAIKDILNKRGIEPISSDVIDATEVFKDCPSKIISSALKSKGVVLAVKLPGFAGVLNGDSGKLRLGSELAQRARTHGVKGIFHSDELPNYGIEQTYVDSLKSFLNITEDNDAFVICAAPEKTARSALIATIERANEAFEGVPEETRDPLPDGTSRYSRPLPGAARMYPETDVPPTLVTKEKLTEIRNSMPEFPEEIEKRLVEQYGINAQQAHQMLRESNDDLFVKLAGTYRSLSSVVATTLTNTYSELEREGVVTTKISDDTMLNIFDMLAHNKFAKEALPDIIREVSKGTEPSKAAAKLGLESVDKDEAVKIIADIVKSREDFIRSKG
ncbi:MAG TPA: Glu-tRNA(Gln) amidotransferase subunit GatE, partial [Candidatus Methanomethylophilaceae archaeon]|nr:Glu-tRNA(Gln) amidotransferase subunit GatE [Candidatus Methanomethylophilaceae archaeon]